jgi:hypothetical protein
MILNEKVNIYENEPKTEVVIRTRGKNNNVETKKGYVEVTVEEYKVISLFLIFNSHTLFF